MLQSSGTSELNIRRKPRNKKLGKATSYAEWCEIAMDSDKKSGASIWKSSDRSKHFDYRSIRRRMNQLVELRNEGNDAGLVYAINEGIHGNMDGIGHHRLFERAQFGTKQLIQDYVDMIVDTLEYLASPDVDVISRADKLDLFQRARHCYGSSALLLSGSGAYLYYHIGVAKALWEQNLLPNTLSGSSGGAFVSSMICTRADKKMEEIFDADWIYENQSDDAEAIRPNIWSDKPVSTKKIYDQLCQFIPDLTFEEAFKLTGRHLNISIAPSERHQTSRLLNAIASPNVYIREAVLASCALPGVFAPVSLKAKNHRGKKVPYLPNRRWVDGSMSNDIPAKRLARLYGVNHHIVSQANPLISGLAVDISKKNKPLEIVRDATVKSGIAWANASAALWRQPLELFPRANSTVNLMLSLVNQEYLGDINIIRPKYPLPLNKLVGPLDYKNIKALITLGEKTTWPKLEMVRTQTKISKTLDDILASFNKKIPIKSRKAISAK